MDQIGLIGPLEDDLKVDFDLGSREWLKSYYGNWQAQKAVLQKKSKEKKASL